jgi:hypothetical protein
MSQEEESVHNPDPAGGEVVEPHPPGYARSVGDEAAEADSPEGADDTLPAPESQAPKAPPDPFRRFVRLAWALVLVLVAFVVLATFGMLRISNEINRVACIQNAQAHYASTTNRNAGKYEIGLASLSMRIALKKCGT